jgi:CheY-like chemotaxis protein
MKKLVAVVDDKSQLQRLSSTILESAGYRSVSIDDGQRVLTEVKRIRPDLLLMDLPLGECDALEVLSTLDADLDTGIPVVICCAAHDLIEPHRKRLDKLGCEVVEKPFDVDDLLCAVERTVALAALRGHA